MQMRCFFATPVTGGAARRLARSLALWRAREPQIRWEAPEALHLTLQFIGDWPEERLPELVAAVEGWRWQPFTLTLAGLGAFPNPARPRTLWAGVLPSPELADLASGLARRLAPLGIARELRPFTPHISLARLKPGQRAGSLGGAPSGSMPVSEINLYETVAGAAASSRYRMRVRLRAS